MSPRLEFQVNAPDVEHARAIALQAINRAENKDFQRAAGLIEKAIQLDSIASLNQFYALKVEIYAAMGQDFPQNAVDMYERAIGLKEKNRHRDATLAFLEADSIDPELLWPKNNLAWMLATDPNPSVRNGDKAIQLATEVCVKTSWNCWAFVSTLAAAYAEAGDFRNAIGWQQSVLQIVPGDHKSDSELMLKHFKLGQSYVDEGQPVAAGAEIHRGKKGDNMKSLKLLQSGEISMRELQTFFDEACFETEIDEDGDLLVHDDLNVIVRLPDSGSQISLAAIMSVNANASREQCLEFVNRVNTDMRLVCVAAHDNDIIVFDYVISVAGGITKRTIILAFRYFMRAVHAAANQCDSDDVVSSSD